MKVGLDYFLGLRIILSRGEGEQEREPRWDRTYKLLLVFFSATVSIKNAPCPFPTPVPKELCVEDLTSSQAIEP